MAERLAVDVCQANLLNGRSIYDLITANHLDTIRSLLCPLTLRDRQSIVCQKVSNKTLLGRATELGLRGIVRYLLDECEANISERYTPCHVSLSPLRVAVVNLDVAMIVLLKSRGVVAVDELQVSTCATFAFGEDYFSLGSILDRYIYELRPICLYDFIPHLSLKLDIDLNDDPNHIFGASACGDIDRMKTLLSNCINRKGTNTFEDNALCITILNEEENAEHFLMNHRVFSLSDHVQALELSGAKFIAFNFDFQKGLRCWSRSLRIRNEHLSGISDNCQNRFKTDLGLQFCCEEELDILAYHESELYTQALIVCVRLLSPGSEVLQNAFVLVAQRRVFRKDSMRAITLLAQLSKFPFVPESGYVHPMKRALKTVVPLLRNHFHRDSSDKGKLRFQFRRLVNFINRVNWKMLLASWIEFYSVVYTQLLMLLLLKIVAMKDFDLSATDKIWIKHGLSSIMRFHSYPYPTTLLHLSIKDPTAYSVIPFILSCTADANCRDSADNTPLHIVSHLNIDDTTLFHLVNLFTDAGGHIDSVNTTGRTPLMTMKVKGHIENPLKFLSLQCLAAQTIYDYNVTVPDGYPKILDSFIKLHRY